MRLVRYKPEYQEPMIALHRSARDDLVRMGLTIGISEDEEEADLRAIEQVYLESGGEFLVGLLDGEVIAMGGFQRLASDSAELRRMRIRKDLQDRGYGSHLLKELERLAFQAGIRKISFETAKARPLTLEFYHKHGYQETGIGFYGQVETVHFSKTLAEKVFGAKAESNPKIRLIAVDLDGTLLTSKSVMASEGARLLKAVARDGIHVILVTGRIIHSVRDLCGSLEMPGPVICTDGAQVYESINGPVLTSLTFPKEVGLEIARLADANGWELSTTIGPMAYYRQRPGGALGLFSPGRTAVATNSDAVTDNPTRILASDPGAIEAILSLGKSKFSGRCRIETYHGKDGVIGSVGVLAAGANKGNALDSVLHRLKVRQSEVMAIGDDLNDLPMFSRSGISVAMSNAHEELKNKATTVAPSNDEEGVAWALTKFGVVS